MSNWECPFCINFRPLKMMKVIALVVCLAVAAFAEPLGLGYGYGSMMYGGLGGGLYGINQVLKSIEFQIEPVYVWKYVNHSC